MPKLTKFLKLRKFYREIYGDHICWNKAVGKPSMLNLFFCAL